MTWRELDVEKFNSLKSVLLIDVRSPSEHEKERIPGSINVPLLSDEERAVIGTIYKQQGEMVARRHALHIITPKIPGTVDGITSMRQHGQAVVVYCWRGGLRSESVCSVLSIAGIDCFRLTGGYKAWRGKMLDEFQTDAYPFSAIVLNGLTGSGKTEILSALVRRGIQTLDLESLANHRGSVFGGLGMDKQPTQKNFDAELWTRLRGITKQPVFIEAESRKIGKISLPDCVYNRIQSAPQVLVVGAIDRRAQRLVDDYLRNHDLSHEEDLSEALQLLGFLKERLGSKVVADLQALVRNGQVHDAVKTLLVQYYDPLYSLQLKRVESFALEVDSDDAGKAADAIAAHFQL